MSNTCGCSEQKLKQQQASANGDGTATRGTLDRVEIESGKLIDLIKLHQLVLKKTKRVELVTRDGGTSVLISKSELDALEQALEILGDTEEVRAMQDAIARAVGVVGAGK